MGGTCGGELCQVRGGGFCCWGMGMGMGEEIRTASMRSFNFPIALAGPGGTCLPGMPVTFILGTMSLSFSSFPFPVVEGGDFTSTRISSK